MDTDFTRDIMRHAFYEITTASLPGLLIYMLFLRKLSYDERATLATRQPAPSHITPHTILSPRKRFSLTDRRFSIILSPMRYWGCAIRCTFVMLISLSKIVFIAAAIDWWCTTLQLLLLFECRCDYRMSRPPVIALIDCRCACASIPFYAWCLFDIEISR